MIVRPKLHWFRMLLVWRGSVLARILPQMFTIIALAAAVVIAKQFWPTFLPDLTPLPFTLLGVALAIFLSFRNSVSYDRFWEARKFWGALLNETRALTRQILFATEATKEQQRQFVLSQIAFVYALRSQLRQEPNHEHLQNLVRPSVWSEVQGARFKPAIIARDLSMQLGDLRRNKQVETILFASMDAQVSALSACLGGCERLASTPVPFAYSLILHRTVYFYCFLLPFGLVATLGVMTPLIVAFVAYTFLALEALAEELQDPFGTEPNDLALDAMTETIEASLREMMGEKVGAAPEIPKSYAVT